MRRIRKHAEPLPLERLEGLFPGLESSRVWLEVELAVAIHEAIASGVDWRHRVVHIEPDGVTVVDRAEQVALLRSAGVRGLASELHRAVVPPGHLLAFCDFDGASWTSVASIGAILGEATS